MVSSTADVRQFLTDYFSDEELTTLCFDFFPEVYDSFASGMSKGQKIQLLMEFSRRREQLTELLKVLQQQRPVQFAKRLEQAGSTTPASSSSSQRPVSDPPASSISTVSGGVNLSGDKVTVGKDAVGRDKLIQAGTYIEHATIIQSGSSMQEIKPTAPAVIENRRVMGGLEFVRVPAGKFLMGSKADNKLAYDDERPQHTVEIPYDYWIVRYPVTNEQFARFVTSAKYKFDQGDWKKQTNHPVVKVTWHDALAYCKWLDKTLRGELKDLTLRLPTEAEWEKAARGIQGNEWPWGNDFDKNKCNSSEGRNKGTTPVGAYSPQGDSPYGAADMAGNVREWTTTIWGTWDAKKSQAVLKYPYPYTARDGRESLTGDGNTLRVLRGGSWLNGLRYARCAARYGYDPDYFVNYIGFRVVVSLA